MKVILTKDPTAVRQMLTQASQVLGDAPALGSVLFDPYLSVAKSLYEFSNPADRTVFIGDKGGIFTFDENAVIPLCFHFVCGAGSKIDVTIFDPDGSSHGRKILSTVDGVDNLHYFPVTAGSIYVLKNQKIKVVETTKGVPTGTIPKMMTLYVVKERKL